MVQGARHHATGCNLSSAAGAKARGGGGLRGTINDDLCCV